MRELWAQDLASRQTAPAYRRRTAGVDRICGKAIVRAATGTL
jgi:hypothetical protein